MPKTHSLISIFLVLFFTCNFAIVSAKNYEEGNVRHFEDFILTENFVGNVDETLTDLKKTVEELAMDSIKAKVVNNNLFVSLLDSASFKTLPIGLSSDSESGEANPDYSIIIDKASIHPNYAEFSAFMSIKNPIDGQMVYFRANNIQFSFGGGLQNGFQLELVNEVYTKLSEDSYVTWMPGSFVNWDCKGFESLGLNAKIELSESAFKKVNIQTGAEDGKVSTTTFIAASSFNDLLIDISFDPFKIVGFEEAYFSFKNLTLDCSDTRNSSEFKIPSNYPGDFSGDKTNLWRGFYVQSAEVFFPNLEKEDGSMTTVYAGNLILDDFGLTGIIGGSNILSLEEGKIATWNMSLDLIELEFFTGDFKKLTLEGGILVDGIDDALEYSAYYDAADNYHFAATIGQELPFSAFAAEISLDPTSRIDVEVIDSKFNAAVVLDGGISFKAGKKGNTATLLSIPDVEFQQLRIATKAPIFDIDYIALVSKDKPSDFNAFPISISNVLFNKTSDDYAQVNFDLSINLVPTGDLGISATTNIGVRASTKDKWAYDGLSLSAIAIEAAQEGSFDIKGSIQFVDGDETYGKGFRGQVDATFGGNIEVDAIAVFGRVDGFRYFFVDAFMASKTGIVAGPIILKGFGGGLFYKMKQSNEASSSTFGQSLSEVTYVPDKNSSLIIKAAVSGGIVNDKIIQCNVTFKIAFTSSFGVSSIEFAGEASVLAIELPIEVEGVKELTRGVVDDRKLTLKIPPPMKADFFMTLDCVNNVFHSEMQLFVNIAGALRGVGSNNRAGWGVMHIDPDKWYLHLGTPTDQIGLNFIGLMEVSSYFMAGHDIPDAMMMNSKVLEILNMSQSDFNGNRDENSLILGNGLAFGTHFSISTGDMTFLIFYASLDMGGGFDLMLIDYGDAAYCEGRDGKVGIDGWFAKGQAYAYFAGKVGIKVKVFGKKKNYDILNLQVAAAIRAEGPNPTWMKGVVGGSYKILGGMIKGNCKFEATVGEQCDLKTLSDLSDLEIIADLTPADKSDEVDICSLPQGVFNMPVDKEIKISDDPSLTKTFIIRLEEFKVYTEEGAEYSGTIEWNEDKTALAFHKNRIFDTESTYKVVAKVSFEEKVNGAWSVYKDDNGQKYIESKEVAFETGLLPENLPTDLIEYSYPLDRMVNFYKNEYNKAYIGFNTDVEPFFKDVEGYVQQAKWTLVNGASINTDIEYSVSNRRVETSVPATLQNDKIYHFEMVHVPVADYSTDSNVSENSTEIEDAETEIITRSAEGEINDGETKPFINMAFRCSKYNTFLDKMSEDEMRVSFLYNVSVAIDLPGATLYKDELFDQYEIGSKNKNITALIQREAVLDQADWYQSTYAPMIYNNYPIHSEAKIKGRVLEEQGVPPTKYVDIWQIDYDYTLSNSDVDGGTYNMKPTFSHFVFSLPDTWANDYAEIRNYVSNLLDDNKITNTTDVNTLINTYPWPQTDAGNYPIRLTYTLPGIKTETSSKVINLKNEFDINQVNFYGD